MVSICYIVSQEKYKTGHIMCIFFVLMYRNFYEMYEFQYLKQDLYEEHAKCLMFLTLKEIVKIF